jgi:hypothetical protein
VTALPAEKSSEQAPVIAKFARQLRGLAKVCWRSGSCVPWSAMIAGPFGQVTLIGALLARPARRENKRCG